MQTTQRWTRPFHPTLPVRSPSDRLRREFGRRLARLRKEAGLSQTALAEQCELRGQASISELETGRWWPMTDTLIRIAKELDVSLDYLVFGKRCP